jgi:WD40 repeat protein
VSGALFDSEDRLVLSWSSDGTIRLWDSSSAQQVGHDIRREIGKPMRHTKMVVNALVSWVRNQ